MASSKKRNTRSKKKQTTAGPRNTSLPTSNIKRKEINGEVFIESDPYVPTPAVQPTYEDVDSKAIEIESEVYVVPVAEKPKEYIDPDAIYIVSDIYISPVPTTVTSNDDDIDPAINIESEPYTPPLPAPLPVESTVDAAIEVVSDPYVPEPEQILPPVANVDDAIYIESEPCTLSTDSKVTKQEPAIIQYDKPTQESEDNGGGLLTLLLPATFAVVIGAVVWKFFLKNKD